MSIQKSVQKKYSSPAISELVAHACNPSHLGGRDQEDQGSKSAWAK
jgi:hypothetical protein